MNLSKYLLHVVYNHKNMLSFFVLILIIAVIAYVQNSIVFIADLFVTSASVFHINVFTFLFSHMQYPINVQNEVDPQSSCRISSSFLIPILYVHSHARGKIQNYVAMF